MPKSLSKKDEKIMDSIYIEVIPNLIVSLGQDDLYIKNEKKALKKVSSFLKKHKDFIKDESFVIVENFLEKKNKLKKKINAESKNLKNDDFLMYLFYSTHLFESMINNFLQNELESNHKFTIIQANNILRRIDIPDKLGWFLKVLCKKDYTSNTKHWPTLKRGIQTRNYFIHYKPEGGEKYDKHSSFISKNNIIKFLDSATNCHTFLKKSRTNKNKEFHIRLEKTRALLIERMKNKKNKKNT